MNFRCFFSRVVLIGCLGFHGRIALAQADQSIFGTHAVTYEPGQSAGILHSSTLVFRAVHPDFAYQKGDPNLIVGSIGVRQFGQKLILSIKIGTKNLEKPNSSFIRPNFAYLQTKNETTAKSPYIAKDGEEGFLLIAIGLDDASIKLLFEMVETEKVTLGFNRKQDGLDILVPIDLMVYDSEIYDSGKVIRKRSNSAITKFLDGILSLTKQCESNKIK